MLQLIGDEVSVSIADSLESFAEASGLLLRNDNLTAELKDLLLAAGIVALVSLFCKRTLVCATEHVSTDVWHVAHSRFLVETS